MDLGDELGHTVAQDEGKLDEVLATEFDDNREIPQLETTLRAIDLLEQGLPVG